MLSSQSPCINSNPSSQSFRLCNIEKPLYSKFQKSMGSAAMGTRNLCFSISQLSKPQSNFFYLKQSPSFTRHARIRMFKRAFAANVPAAASASSIYSAAAIEAKSNQDPVVEDEVVLNKRSNFLACPICYESLTGTSEPGLSESRDSISGSNLQCGTCKKSYVGDDTHLDLTAASGAKNYGEPMPISTELFRTPLVSFLYERGWRQSFTFWGGFPGPEKEFEMMKSYLQPVLGGRIVDASCGSGLFSRLFGKSGLFSSVVALDYSENMLKQCYEFIKQEENFPTQNFILVRADIARLPFVSRSIDAVHAGAAIHCWPSPSQAVAEISRVLRPGGVFVATTFILDGPFAFVPFIRIISQNIRLISGNSTFLSESELEDLCSACGLVNFSCKRNGPFVMISATKPS